MATKKLTKWCIIQTHEIFESIELTVLVDQRRDTNLLGRKAPSSFFFFYPNGILSLPPGLTQQPGAVYLSPFCIGQFPLFRGISKPILGLAWAATGDSPRHPHRRAFPHSPSVFPSSVLFSLSLLRPSCNPRQSPLSRPALPTDPSFQPPPLQKEKSLRLLVPGRGWVVSTLTGDVTGATRLADAVAVTSHRTRSLADTFYRHFYCTPSLIAAEVGDTNRGGSNEFVLSQTLHISLSLSLSLSLFLSLLRCLYLSTSLSSRLYHSLCGSMALPKSTSWNIRSDVLVLKTEYREEKNSLYIREKKRIFIIRSQTIILLRLLFIEVNNFTYFLIFLIYYF